MSSVQKASVSAADALLSGQAKAAPPSVTMEDIASHCRVSAITVSRVFTTPHLVREHTREKILCAARELGYSYNELAGTLRKRHTPFIGLITTVANDSQFLTIIRATQQYATDNGLQTLLGLSELNTGTELGLIKRYMQLRARGLVIYGPTNELLAQHGDRLIQASTPVVVVGEMVDDERCHCIGHDLAGACAEMTRHLLHMGHRRIGFQCGPDTVSRRAMLRQKGYTEALQTHGIEPEMALIARTSAGLDIHEEDHIGLGYTLMERFLHLPRRPTAVIFASDPFALGGLLALRDAGLHVPQDMSVVSTQEYPFSAKIHPALTTMRVPCADIARLTISFLGMCGASTPGTPFRHCLPTQLIPGDSTAPRH